MFFRRRSPKLSFTLASLGLVETALILMGFFTPQIDVVPTEAHLYVACAFLALVAIGAIFEW